MTASPTFGAFLRQLRKRAGMTQGDLAAAVGYSVSFVCDLEQNRRLPAVSVILQQFVPALGLQEEAGFAAHLVKLAAQARGERAPSTVTIQRSARLVVTDTFKIQSSHLPAPPTALIGREQAVKTLCNRFQGHSGRLLTLVGPPGVGKTRLGLEVARRLEPLFKDGARFVPLAAVSDLELVATVIANELNLADSGKQSPQSRLIQGLRQQELLLVLDNFEQIIGVAPLLATVLTECPRVHLLVTSRERLHLRAEQRFPVPPLEVAMAVELFVQCGQAVAPNFSVTTDNQAVIHELCRRLDYLPLAIELLAARIDLYTPQALLARLQDHSLDLLVDGPRDLAINHRTLRNAIHHSYALLEEREQRLFRTLGVFVGGFDLAVVAHWGFAEAELQALIHKNLVQIELPATDTHRYLLLETLRAYALEQLEQHNEAATMGRAHATYFLRLAEGVIRAFKEEGEREAVRGLEAEMNNLWAALRWAAHHDSGLELHLLTNLLPFWNTGRSLQAGWRWVEEALPRIKAKQTLLYADFLYELAVLNWKQGTPIRIQHYAEASIALCRQLDYPTCLVRALVLLSGNVEKSGDYAAARTLAEEAVQISRTLDRPHLLAAALDQLRWVMIALGDYTTARTLLDEAVMLWRLRENPFEIGLALRRLAHVAFLAGDLANARAQAEEALQIFRDLGEPWAIAQSLTWLARITCRQGDKVRALAVLEENLALTHQLKAEEFRSCVLLLLGLLAQERGDEPQARHCLRTCFAIMQEHDLLQDTGSQASMAYLLGGLAGLVDPLHAAGVLGSATRLLTTATALQDFVVEHSHYERILAAVRDQVDETTFAAAYAEGYAINADQAVAIALAHLAEIVQGQ